jgi:hypothetical protein
MTRQTYVDDGAKGINLPPEQQRWNGQAMTCDCDERLAVARIRWTVYGGAYKYAYVCEYHRSCTEGQRGVDVIWRRGEHVAEVAS